MLLWCNRVRNAPILVPCALGCWLKFIDGCPGGIGEPCTIAASDKQARDLHRDMINLIFQGLYLALQTYLILMVKVMNDRTSTRNHMQFLGRFGPRCADCSGNQLIDVLRCQLARSDSTGRFGLPKSRNNLAPELQISSLRRSQATSLPLTNNGKEPNAGWMRQLWFSHPH